MQCQLELVRNMSHLRCKICHTNCTNTISNYFLRPIAALVRFDSIFKTFFPSGILNEGPSKYFEGCLVDMSRTRLFDHVNS